MSLASLRRTPPFDRALFLLSRWTPKLERVLLVESGSRIAAAHYLEQLYDSGENRSVDVLTCYQTPPATFDESRGRVFYTHAAEGSDGRRQLFRLLSTSGYTALCVLCTGDDIMTRWKWLAAMRVPAKLMLVNENANSFWLDRGHLRSLGSMWVERSGVREMAPLRMLGQAAAFPFIFLFLLGFAAYVELRRVVRAVRTRPAG